MSIQGVILDIDGTLIDSNDAHAHAWVDAIAAEQRAVKFDRVRELIGMGGDKLLPEVTGIETDSDVGRRMTSRRLEIFKTRYLPSIRPFPGVRALLERFRADGLKLVVATSAEESVLKSLLQVAQVEDLIERSATSDDAERSKPDPDIVHAALQRSKLAPHQVVMIGDTPYDVEAAAAAGVKTIAFRSGGWADAPLSGAIAIYDGAADLLARYETSPFRRVQEANATLTA